MVRGKHWTAGLTLVGLLGPAGAAEGVFELGGVEVRSCAEADGSPANVRLERQELERFNRNTLADTPRNRLFAWLGWQPSERWEYQVSMDAENGRQVAYGSGNAATYTCMPGFALANLKAVHHPLQGMDLELGVSNLFDADYALADGYPMPGRMWFANLRQRF